ncbi:MAG: PEGA domain-containing protein [Candidatus Aminicenantes bacterium]|nr:PEGA domain-containing protein [Candidatus Aminicenantes bacterium]
MNIKTNRRKGIAYGLLILFLILVAKPPSLNGVGFQKDRAKIVLQEGIDLYEEGELEKAVSKFSSLLAQTEDKDILTDACFYLSLIYFRLGETLVCRQWIKKVLVNAPGRNPESTDPPDFIKLFDEEKRIYGVELMERERAEKKISPTKDVKETKAIAEKREPVEKIAVKTGGKKSGGKTLFLVIGGILIAGGVAALLLLKGKEKEEAGSIQVNSIPSGGNVFLDGADTGKLTNCTLTGLAAGMHSVGIYRDGYEDFVQNVSVEAGKTATVNAMLTAHSITVTQPTGSTIWTHEEDVVIEWTVDGSNLRTGLKQEIRNAALDKSRSFVNVQIRRRAMQGRYISNHRRGTDRKSRLTKDGAPEASGAARPQGDIVVGTDGALKNKDPETERINPSRMNRAPTSFETGLQEERGPAAISSVKIDLYRNSDLADTIASETPNNGSFNWTVDSSLSEGDNYRIRISCTSDSSVYGESDAFEIVHPRSRIAYVYDGDTDTANSFKDFLETKGFQVTLVPLSTVSSGMFSAYDLIIICTDTGYWDNINQVQAINNSGKPIIGQGRGGYYFFGELNLNIGYPNGMSAEDTNLIVLESSHPVFNSPNDMNVTIGQNISLYTSTISRSIHLYSQSIPVIPLAESVDFPGNYLLLIEQERYMLWGFAAGPNAMTKRGKDLFENVVHFMRGE